MRYKIKTSLKCMLKLNELLYSMNNKTLCFISEVDHTVNTIRFIQYGSHDMVNTPLSGSNSPISSYPE